MSMSNEQRLTAEEFRDAVILASENSAHGDDFLSNIDGIIRDELAHREELAAMDFNDCEGGACKL